MELYQYRELVVDEIEALLNSVSGICLRAATGGRLASNWRSIGSSSVSARGYKSAWAAHKFPERFGQFPPWEWNRSEPLPACGAVEAWVRSRHIAYAKATRASR